MIYYGIALTLAFALGMMILSVSKEEKRRKSIIRSIRPKTPVWVVYAGEPTKMLLVHHGNNFATCRYLGEVLNINYDRIIIEI